MRKWRFYLCSKNSKIREIMKNETEKQTINAAEKHNPLVIVDNGHGMQTPGKRSPDGSVLEWEWTRRVAGEIVGRLSKTPVDAVLLVPEDDDIPLPPRCRRARRLAEGRCAVLLSVHVNASRGGACPRILCFCSGARKYGIGAACPHVYFHGLPARTGRQPVRASRGMLARQLCDCPRHAYAGCAYRESFYGQS